MDDASKNAIQYDGFVAGDFNSSVNLFRGEAYFDYPLISGIPDKDGLGIFVSASYISHTDRASRRDNLSNPTGILGLGWQMSSSAIMRVNSTFIMPPEQEVFCISDPSGISRLFHIKNDWQIAKLSDNMRDELKKSEVSQTLKVAFSLQGVAVAAGSQIISHEDIYSIVDIANELEFRIDGNNLNVYYGGLMFENANYDFSRIFYFPQFEKWLIIQKDGARKIYGGISDKALEYTVHYDGAVLPSSNTNGQARAVHKWNLAKEVNIWDDEITYAYVQETRLVGVGGLEYTRACYLSRIENSFGYVVTFDYADKLFTDTAKEYIDPHFPFSSEPITTATPYQSYYETRYLKKFHIYEPSGDILESTDFEYDVKVLHGISSIPGANVKRLLKSISKRLADGTKFPPVQFTYVGGMGINLGAISSVLTMAGSKVKYTYGKKELKHSSKRNYTIRKDNFTNHKIVSGADYSAVLLYNDAASRFRLYSWVGRFQTWTPSIEPTINDTTVVITLDKCVILQTKINNTTKVDCYRQNPDILGSWTLELSEVFREKRCLVTGAGDWFAVYERNSGRLNVYTYDLKARKTNKIVGNLGTKNECFIAPNGNSYALLEYDAGGVPGRKSSILSIFELDGMGNWSKLADTKLPKLVAAKDKYNNSLLTLSYSGILCVISSVHKLQANGFDYRLNVLKFGTTVENLYEKDFGVICGKSIEDVPALLWVPEIAEALIVTGTIALAYDGTKIHENNSLSLAGFDLNTGIFFRAVGNNCILQTLVTNTEEIKKVMAQVLIYDPVNSFKGARPVTILADRPKEFKEGGYIPTINGNIATLDDKVFDLNRPKPFEPIYTLDRCVSSKLINGRDYFVYEDTSKSLQSMHIINGKPQQGRKINGRLAQASNSPSIFAAEDDVSITLYVYTGECFDTPVPNFQLAAIEADDSFAITTRKYHYCNEKVACDSSGLAKYHVVDVFDHNPEDGFTRYSYVNSLASVFPTENTSASFAIDGQLCSTTIFGKNDEALSQTKFTYNFVRKVAKLPGGERDVDIYGAVMESSEVTTDEAGVISNLYIQYDTFNGETAVSTTSSYDVFGNKTEIVRKTYPAALEYPELTWQNRISNDGRNTIQWQKNDEEPQIVEAHAQIFRHFHTGKRNILISSQNLLYKDNDNWKILSNITEMDVNGNVIAQDTNEIFAKHYYSKDSFYRTASVTKINSDAPDIVFCTFEDYEDIPIQWQDYVTTDKAIFGSASLRIPKNSNTEPLKLRLVRGEYGIAFWNLGEVTVSVSGNNVKVEKSTQYDGYNLLQLIVLEDADTLFTFHNKSNEDAYIDVFTVFQLNFPPEINIYKERLLDTNITGYNDFSRTIYNRRRRVIGSFNRKTQASLTIPFNGRLAEFDKASSRFNYEFNAIFGNFARYEPEGEPNRTITMPGENVKTAAVYVDVCGRSASSISLGSAVVSFSENKWTLEINDVKHEVSGTTSNGEWFLVIDRELLFFFNGENIFNIAKDAYKEPLTLILSGDVRYKNLLYGTGVSYGVRYLDTAGRVRQGHMYGEDGITVTQTFYDKANRIIAHSKPVVLCELGGQK